MNQDRRAKIEKTTARMQALLATLREEASELSALQEEEQECFDNLPEGLQQADRGQSMEAIADAMYDAIRSVENSFEDLDSALEEVLGSLDN